MGSRLSTLLLLLLIVPGCARFSNPQFESAMTEAELHAKRGLPERTYAGPGREEARVAVYANEESFQIENGRVVSRIREPAGDELTLRHWRLKYASESPRLQRRRDGKLHELRIPGAGRTVLYDPSARRVVKVLEYAPVR